MNCPKCTAPMEPVSVGGYQVERCAACAGLWFDLREHEHIAARGSDVRRLDTGNPTYGHPRDAQRNVDCPCCHVRMLTLSVPEQAHIHYESCPVCHGAYFDAGEFTDYASLNMAERVRNFFKGFRRRAG